ncbi:MAG: DNA alkylation repair protein [Candidatus ainarchaeum sp.]|nr:DNA alkylation repair protein [Candidatus ainarchaeum sp.]
MDAEEILLKLKAMKNQHNIEGMARFGINPKNTLGVPIPALWKIGQEHKKSHLLAQQLWESRIHEARILACIIENPAEVSEKQLEEWAKDFDSWDVCDQCCMHVFDKTEFAYKKAVEWPARKEEFVKRAGFALMATLSVHDKKAGNENFLQFLQIIKREATDERNFVKKAVNWALRQVGKRNKVLNRAAIKTAREILKIDSKSAKWIAKDALKELKSTKVLSKLK